MDTFETYLPADHSMFCSIQLYCDVLQLRPTRPFYVQHSLTTRLHHYLFVFVFVLTSSLKVSNGGLVVWLERSITVDQLFAAPSILLISLGPGEPGEPGAAVTVRNVTPNSTIPLIIAAATKM